VRTAVVAGVVLAAVALGGCESSFEQSARLEKQGGVSQSEKGLSISDKNNDVTVADTELVTDENGTAVVVSLKSTAKSEQVNVPIALDVLDKQKASVFKNDTPGLEPSLTEADVVPPGDSEWVNDQIQAAGEPATAKATVGEPKQAPPAELPKLTVSDVKIQNDATSGVLASGKVTNESKVEQTKLVISGIARDGKKLVAAGRAVLPKLKPGKSGVFRIFFIGDPRKGKLTVLAPPSTFK
jgi:hypothetical protein